MSWTFKLFEHRCLNVFIDPHSAAFSANPPLLLIQKPFFSFLNSFAIMFHVGLSNVTSSVSHTKPLPQEPSTF